MVDMPTALDYTNSSLSEVIAYMLMNHRIRFAPAHFFLK